METPESWANEIVGRAARAADVFLEFDHARTDRIVHAVFEAAFAARLDLARLAHEETGMGVVAHKVLKNAWASLLVYDDLRRRRTVGTLRQDRDAGITEIARPKGPLLATLPITNPTSTTIFKALLCMKTRNPVIFSPHRGARKCTKEAVRVCAEAAAAAGAPSDAIQCITKSQTEYTLAAMRHPDLALILATGTGSIVRAAHDSGTPTLGVGPGNVPVYVHASADIPAAARDIVRSKTFDHGVVCASEQALIVERDVLARIRPLLEARGAHFCDGKETRLLGPKCYDPTRDGMRADVVGQAATVIAERAGFAVPPRTRLLVAELEGVGPEHPLSYEILAPVLACYVVSNHRDAIAKCAEILAHGGRGHTIGVHTRDESVVEDAAALDVARVLVNQPCTQGAVGGVVSALAPSLTLSCGRGGRNLNTDNITVEHLLNVHRIARPHENARWNAVPKETWTDPAADPARVLETYRAGDRD
jgi:acetaldehyde dehydrogenase/alcohol dehydrogenase